MDNTRQLELMADHNDENKFQFDLAKKYEYERAFIDCVILINTNNTKPQKFIIELNYWNSSCEKSQDDYNQDRYLVKSYELNLFGTFNIEKRNNALCDIITQKNPDGGYYTFISIVD